MITLTQYEEKKFDEWDSFIEHSKGSTLHSYRKFLNYHKDKFQDSSLMFYHNNNLVAVLPGVLLENSFISHPGASYGGLIYKEGLKIDTLYKIHEEILNYSKENKVHKIEFRFPYSIISKHYFDSYKYILHSHSPIIYREVSQFIDLTKFKEEKSFSDNFKRILNKNYNLKTSEAKNEKDIENFYNILCDNLLKHDTEPTHTLSELKFILKNLASQSRLFVTKDTNSNIVSGSFALLLNDVTPHLFYLCTDNSYLSKSPLVKTIYDVSKYFKLKDSCYLNLGISTENRGQILNYGLNNFKEKFNTQGTFRETIIIDI